MTCVSKWLIIGKLQAHCYLIRINRLLMEKIEALNQLVLQKATESDMRAGSD